MIELFLRQRLALLRADMGLSARELSLRLGQSEGYINAIETGKSNPSLSMLYYICQELGVSLSEFFDEGNKHPIFVSEIVEEAKRLDRQSLESILSVMKNMEKR